MCKLKLSLTAVIIIFLLQNILFAQPVSQLILTSTDTSKFGNSVACAGDLNGDGYEDIIIGNERTENYPDLTYIAKVFFGGKISHNIPDLILKSPIPDQYGHSVSSAGDVNGDGFTDIIVGAYHNAYIFFGGIHMDSIPDVILTGDGGSDYFGTSVSGAGDVNNDDYDDVIVGAYNYSLPLPKVGRAHLFLGGVNMDNTVDLILEADTNHKQFGAFVKGIGDMNEDGFDDFMVSATAGATSGRAYLYYGSSILNNVADKIFTDYGQGGNFGISIAVSEINGDNKNDLIISTIQNHGGFHVFYGSNDIDTISDAFVGNTVSVYEDFGRSISTDDFNNDGYGDVIIGAWGNNSNRGKVHVYFGGVTMDNTPDIIYTGENAGDKFGFSVSTAGNFNGDGKPGYIIGAPDFNSQSGRVYLYQNSIITSVNPDQNEINVTKSSDVTVSFGVGMNTSSINSSNIKVFGHQSGLKTSTVSYNTGTRTATINPNSDFKVGEKIQVTLSSGIQTSSNTPITPFTWTFTVQALGGTGLFTEASVIDSVNLSTVQPAVETRSADFDSDGDLDLITNGYYNGVHIYKNNGSGIFTETQIITGLPNVEHYQGLCLGDFNSDGDVDIALAVATNTSFVANLITFSNDGAGNFAQTALSVGGGIGGATGDLDGDGDLDIVMSWALDRVRYCINDGNGNFTNFEIINLGYFHSNGCDIGDIDNDGDIDIMISIQTFPLTKQVMLLNDGSANFSQCNTFTTTSYFDDQKLVDINGDRNLDLIGRNYIYTNNGSCSFTQNSLSAGSQVMPFDYDGDGDIDMVYSYNPGSNASCYTNSGSGVFANTSNPVAGNITNAGGIGDFDNDGDLDFTLNNSGGHGTGQSDISVLLNDYSCAHIPYSISGNFAIPVATSDNVFTSSGSNGFWDIRNFGNTRATIPPNSTNDTVIVTAGDSLGFFVLYYIAYHNCGGDTLLSKHVYIEDPSSPMDFSIKAIPEGFLNTSTNKLNSIDTFNVYLRNRAAPYALVDSAKGVIDIDSFTIQSSFLNAPTGLYFIVLKHRNTIETWSNSFGVVFVRGNDNSYDFTTSKFQAYANNLVLKGGRYCLYSGDVGQDGFIDASDLSQVENAVGAGSSGYINTDINGDNYSDAEDISIVENNLSKSLKSPLNGDFFNTPEPEDQVIENTANFKNEKIEVDKASKVNEYTLSDNYPNPFNPTTKISYEIPNSNLVSLKVFDMLGKEVTTLINEKQNAGKYTVEFNAGSLPSGAYFYKIVSGDFVKVKKMVLVK